MTESPRRRFGLHEPVGRSEVETSVVASLVSLSVAGHSCWGLRVRETTAGCGEREKEPVARLVNRKVVSVQCGNSLHVVGIEAVGTLGEKDVRP